MKKFEVGILITLFFAIITNIWIDDHEVTLGLFGILLSIISASYLLGGYFLFKPKEDIKSWKFTAIINGVIISLSPFLLIGKLALPTLSYRIFILFLVPLFLVMIYLGYRVFRKSATNNEKSYFLISLIKNIFIFLVTLITTTIPGDTFSKYVYGLNSDMYYRTLQELNLDDAYILRQKGKIKQAIDKLNTALSYSELLNNKSSTLYQECMNELGYDYYLLDEYNIADSLFDITLKIYENERIENIQIFYNEESQKTYFDAIYSKALLHSSWGNYDKSDSLYDIARIFYKDDLNLSYINSRIGYNQSRTGDFKTADSLYSIAKEYHLKTNLKDKKSYLWLLTNIAENYMEMNDFYASDSTLSYCLSFAKTEFGLSDENVANVLDLYVSLNLKQAKFDIAEKYCLESVKIKEQKIGKQSVGYLNSTLDLVSIYLATSKYQESEDLLKENLNIIESNFDIRSPIATRLYDILSEYHENYMNYNQAEDYAEKSVNGRVYWNGTYDIKTATSYHNLASALYYQSKYDYADSLYSLALKIKKYYKGIESPSYANSLNGLTLIYIERDSLELANEYLNYCLEIYENSLGAKHPDYATILANKAYLKIKENQFNDADKLFLEALSIYQKSFNEKHIKIAITYYDLGIMETNRNRIKQAIDYFIKAEKIYKTIYSNDHYFIKHLKEKIETQKQELNNKEN